MSTWLTTILLTAYAGAAAYTLATARANTRAIHQHTTTINQLADRIDTATTAIADHLEAATLNTLAQLVEAGVVEDIDLTPLADVAQSLRDFHTNITGQHPEPQPATHPDNPHPETTPPPTTP